MKYPIDRAAMLQMIKKSFDEAGKEITDIRKLQFIFTFFNLADLLDDAYYQGCEDGKRQREEKPE